MSVSSPSLTTPVSTTRSGWPIEPPDFGSVGETLSVNVERLGAMAVPERADLPTWIDRLATTADPHRWGSPSLRRQLAAALKQPVDTVIINSLDATPATCIQAAVLSRYPAEVFAGACVLGGITGSRRVLHVVDQNAPGAWFAKSRAIAKLDIARKSAHRWISLANDYPQAEPTLMLYTILRRKLRPGRLPVERGVLMIDAAAAMQVGHVALHGAVMTDVPLAVRDHLSQRTHFLLVSATDKAGDVLSRLRIMVGEHRMLRRGDLLRDLRITADEIIGGGDPVLHVSAPEPAVNPDPCIRCGWCVDACPTRVQPALMLEAAQRGDMELAERAGIEACIDCGVCAYVCPSRLPLLTVIRSFASKKNIGFER